jgi:hypothetical protein
MVEVHRPESLASNSSGTRNEVDSSTLENDPASEGSHPIGNTNIDTSTNHSKESASIISSEQTNQDNCPPENCAEHSDLMLKNT